MLDTVSRESGISVKLLTPPAREAVHVQQDASESLAASTGVHAFPVLVLMH